MSPPNIIQFNASNVPVVQVTLESKTLPEQQLSDWANNFLRLRLFTIPGISMPGAYGGKNRQIIVEVDLGEGREQGAVADGRRQRARRDERHHPGRHRPHRPEGIQRPAQFKSGSSWRSSATCRSACGTEFRFC